MNFPPQLQKAGGDSNSNLAWRDTGRYQCQQAGYYNYVGNKEYFLLGMGTGSLLVNLFATSHEPVRTVGLPGSNLHSKNIGKHGTKSEKHEKKFQTTTFICQQMFLLYAFYRSHLLHCFLAICIQIKNPKPKLSFVTKYSYL